MGWQDAPLVEGSSSGSWRDAPLVTLAGPSPEEPDNTPKEEPGLLARIGQDLRQRVENVRKGAPTGAGIINNYLWNPLTNAFNAGGQAVNALGDAVLETGKSAYNVLMPQSAKDLNAAVAKSVEGSFTPGTIEAAKVIPGTLNEMARQNPKAAIAADSALGWMMAGPILKGGAAAGKEVGNIATDTVASKISPDYLANMATSSLKLPTVLAPEKRLQMGRDLLDSGLTARDAPKLIARSKELSAKVRDAIAPVADTQFEGEIPSHLRDLSYLDPYRPIESSSLVAGLQGKPVGKFNITRGEEQLLKQRIDADLNANWERSFKDKANAWSDDEIRAAKELRGILQKDIEAAVPAVKPLNAENSKLIRLEPFIKRVTNTYTDAKGKPISTAVKGHGGIAQIPLVETAGNMAEGVEQKLAKNLWARQQAGPSSALGKFLSKGLISPKDAEVVLADIKPELLALPAPERGFTLGKTGKVESTKIARLGAAKPIQEAQKALPAPTAIPESGEGAAITDSLARMFQIAQSPAGKRLLLERLAQEEKYSKLVEELKQVPTTNKALPAGIGFNLPTKAETAQVLAGPKVANALGVKNIPGGAAPLGAISPAEIRRLNALARGLTKSNR